ncbi:hypothetical protein TUBRATIS_003370 [Tubulinosema ratisbonensis]|uniref:Uncharacterized protein n=1 Tax=Tubulinosema ratisbonensis TaxID=291195 RepID=A0A437AQ50_9MICR|nr:hypothetical protein TUBRATIS_003370 [Tubulinosema ratisbonensis]
MLLFYINIINLHNLNPDAILVDTFNLLQDVLNIDFYKIEDGMIKRNPELDVALQEIKDTLIIGYNKIVIPMNEAKMNGNVKPDLSIFKSQILLWKRDLFSRLESFFKLYKNDIFFCREHNICLLPIQNEFEFVKHMNDVNGINAVLLIKLRYFAQDDDENQDFSKILIVFI